MSTVLRMLRGREAVVPSLRVGPRCSPGQGRVLGGRWCSGQTSPTAPPQHPHSTPTAPPQHHHSTPTAPPQHPQNCCMGDGRRSFLCKPSSIPHPCCPSRDSRTYQEMLGGRDHLLEWPGLVLEASVALVLGPQHPCLVLQSWQWGDMVSPLSGSHLLGRLLI